MYDHLEGKATPTRRKSLLLDGLVDNRIRYDRKGHPIIIVRRSTTTTACSELTLEFDSGCFSVDDDDDDDELVDDDISAVASLVDDETVDECDSVTTYRPTKRQSQDAPNVVEDVRVPRILILGLEPRNGTAHVRPSRQVTEEVGKAFQASNKPTVEVESAVILTDSVLDDDSRNDNHILAMSSIEKAFQRTQCPDLIFVITGDSDTSDIALEGYHNDQTSANTMVFNLLGLRQSHEIPICAKPIFGSNVCRQWSDRFEKAGAFSEKQVPILFFHLPPLTPDTAVYHHQPYLKTETSVKGVSAALHLVSSRLAVKKSAP